MLTDGIPPELGALSELRALVLRWNYLSGPIPPELGRLVNLQLLDVTGNNLSGCVPVELPELVVVGSGLERCKAEEVER